MIFLENELEPTHYLGLYLLSGLFASLLHTAADPESLRPCVWASGAVAGMMGAFLIRYYKTKIRFFYLIWPVRPLFGTVKVRVLYCLPLWFIQEFSAAKTLTITGVAHWAHVGGFVLDGCLTFGLQVWGVFRGVNPEGDDYKQESYEEAMEKSLEALEDKSRFVQDATKEEMPMLLALLRAEPENNGVRLRIAVIQCQHEMKRDAALSYNQALDHAFVENHTASIDQIYDEVVAGDLLDGENIIRLSRQYECTGRYRHVVKLLALHVKRFPQSVERPKILYKIYQICRNNLRNEVI